MKSMFKKLDSAAEEIKLIVTQGRKAKEVLDPKAIQLFKGMYTALERYYQKFESSWEALVDEFEDAERSSEFPTDAYQEIKNSMRRYYYEAIATFQAFEKPAPPVGATS
ncbi:unnamed protein product, partial [Nesidiocoris tenuis]